MASAQPNHCLLPQLTVEKLISKGRILTMANQVLTVNISEEVRSVRSVGSWVHESVQEPLALFMPVDVL